MEPAPRLSPPPPPERLYLRLDGDPVYAPETTVPAGTLREFAVPAPLQAQVAHLIAYQEALPPGTVVHERVLPDGALRLSVDSVAGTVQIAGPSVRPVQLALRGPLRGLSLTLRPGAAPALFGGLPAHALAERQLDWDTLVPPALRGLALHLQEAPDEAARVQRLVDALARAQRPADPAASADLRKVRQAVALLRPGAGEARIAEAAAAVGVGERRLQQLFRAQLGLSPRTWSRLMRLHGCLQRLREPGPPRWSELALDSGFYDQSHLVREFQALCGLSPGAFLQRRRVSLSSKTAR
ncbi:helix-turn-helix domain-containing protein [Xenophilus sp. Marseille-Q4582]|uniref:helix-turn-helix domain-containing protein n=1 Tax=Xenophilus sp. Marseille-Q4582 TaxID=2866600 RepID=UPI001CE4A2B4|nr:helix-turn-helix domain-containing protein [Xenophilus sp. Marseille-Q4582]